MAILPILSGSFIRPFMPIYMMPETFSLINRENMKSREKKEKERKS